MHALKGLTNNKIIKVKGKMQEGDLMILIDSGNIHSFLDESTAKKVHCRLTRTQPLSMTVANGNKVLSNLACTGFCWQIQGELFEQI